MKEYATPHVAYWVQIGGVAEEKSDKYEMLLECKNPFEFMHLLR